MLKLLLPTLAFFSTSFLYAQLSITEDRMYLKVSSDVAKLEQNIYLPRLSEKEYSPFIKWEYEYKNAVLQTEKSFSGGKETLWSETIYEYNEKGQLIKASCSDPTNPKLDYHSLYEYNENGYISKIIQTNILSGRVYRVDKFSKYKDAKNYKMETELFGDGMKFKYTSLFIDGLKRTLIHKKQFAPVKYYYDTTGRLISRNDRKYFYKFDERGNPIASVQIESGMKTYNFIRLTYADGTVTGKLETDEEFIKKYHNEN